MKLPARMIFFTAILGLYCFMLILFILGWHYSVRPQSIKSNTDQSITVVIPVRNEEFTIGKLLDDLARQLHKPDKIVIIDDHSIDGTKEVINSILIANNSITLLSLTEEEGKKKALDLGISHTKTALIVTTDSDCRVGERWLQSIHQKFKDQSVKMVAGGVRIVESSSLFSRLQAMDVAALIGSGASTLTMGFPTMSNGANLAFRKEVYEEVGGYNGNFHIASGDDEFLMRKVYRRYPNGVKFNEDPNSVVTTGAQKSLRDFFNQRIRWASKWRSHRELASILLAVFIFIVHGSLCILFIKTLLGDVRIGWTLGLLLTKAGIEFIFLRMVMKFLTMPWRLVPFLLWQAIYSPYTVVFGILSNLLAYRWKGRKLHS